MFPPKPSSSFHPERTKQFSALLSFVLFRKLRKVWIGLDKSKEW
jgi:hypothetical protein